MTKLLFATSALVSLGFFLLTPHTTAQSVEAPPAATAFATRTAAPITRHWWQVVNWAEISRPL